MKRVKLAILGAGGRGMFTYGYFAVRNPDKIEIVAVADPDENKLETFRQYGITNTFKSWEEVLAQPKLADAVIIATPDYMHIEPAQKAMEKGYHIMVEKPISPFPKECIALGRLAGKYNKVFVISHVLRYSPFFRTIKALVDSGRIGQLITIEHSEYVERIHQAHSYVRGNWRNTKETSPMLLAKSCHDLDIISWLAGSKCKTISSFGSLSYFKKENAPAAVPDRCMEGCPVSEKCPYNAIEIYVNKPPETSMWRNYLTLEQDPMTRMAMLAASPYGKCVYRCDNDAVDHQVVAMEFENQVTAVFTMTAFHKAGRAIKLMGTDGEIQGNFGIDNKYSVKIADFAGMRDEEIIFHLNPEGHGGSDDTMMNEFIRMIKHNETKGLTDVEGSIHSHMMCFAAEASRAENKTVCLDAYQKSIF